MKKILACTDLSENSIIAVNAAFELTQGTDVQVKIAHCVQAPSHQVYSGLEDIPMGQYTWTPPQGEELKKKILGKINKSFPQLEVAPSQIEILEGAPEEEISKYIDKNKVDLLVIGLKGHNIWERLMIGSLALKLLKYTKTSVYAVHPKHKSPPQKALYACDFQSDSAKAYDVARFLYPVWPAKFYVYHIINPQSLLFNKLLVNNPVSLEGLLEKARPQVKQELDKLIENWDQDRSEVVIETSTDVSTGKTISQYCEKNLIDVAIIGSHSRQGLSKFLLGSNAEYFVNNPPCSIFLAR